MAKKKATRSQLATGLGLGAVIKNTPKPDTIAKIPINQIIANEDQPRKYFDDETLEELSESIKVHGLIQPITVRKNANGLFEIISGERRWRASKLIGLKEIPAYVRVVSPQEVKEMALVENIQRDNLNPLEMAKALWMLREEFKLTIDEVAKRIGKKRPTVSGYLSILRLSDTIKEGLDDGSISMGHAKALIGLEDIENRGKFYTQTIENNWSVRALEDAIRVEKDRLGLSKKPSTAKASLPTGYQAVLDALKKELGSGKINIKLKPDGKGQIVLPFTNTDELNRFLDRMGIDID